MTTTAADFLAKAEAAITAYPNAAALYRIQDPRIVALVGAMAAMLALSSEEQAVAAMEPFTKARDVTVLADAAVKGVLPFGTGQRSVLTVKNVTDAAFTLAAGRRLLDPQGRVHIVTVGATVPAQGQASITVKQEVTTVLTHKVTQSQPFYAVPIDAPETGYLSAIAVTDSSGNQYSYKPAFANTELDEYAYNMESDEERQLTVRFGAEGIGGYQPGVGETLLIAVSQTEGAITLSANAPFVLEYTPTRAEAGAVITLAEVVAGGKAPMDIETLREVTGYPSLYDESAVFLGEWDFLLRKNLPGFRFLSVWNERHEEAVRGASVDNMNTLFIAAQMDDVDSASLFTDITRVIKRADDSYRLKQVPVAEVAIPVEILLIVPSIYDADTVRSTARALILKEYGRDSAFAKRGRSRILHRRIITLLQSSIAACQAEGADIQVSVKDSSTILPESYRYVSEASLVLNVEPPEE